MLVNIKISINHTGIWDSRKFWPIESSLLSISSTLVAKLSTLTSKLSSLPKTSNLKALKIIIIMKVNKLWRWLYNHINITWLMLAFGGSFCLSFSIWRTKSHHKWIQKREIGKVKYWICLTFILRRIVGQISERLFKIKCFWRNCKSYNIISNININIILIITYLLNNIKHCTFCIIVRSLLIIHPPYN